MATSNFFFIDSRVADYEILITGLPVGAEWHLLDSEEEGIGQMARILSRYSSLDSIQIISHGSTGTLHLGSTVLNSDNLSAYQNQLQVIGSSLTETGDILLYGCNVSQGEAGVSFVNSFAQITGADVAASNNATGYSISAGDWVMEYVTGKVDAQYYFNNYYTKLLDALGPALISAAIPLSAGDVGYGESVSGNLNPLFMDYYKVAFEKNHIYRITVEGNGTSNGNFSDAAEGMHFNIFDETGDSYFDECLIRSDIEDYSYLANGVFPIGVYSLTVYPSAHPIYAPVYSDTIYLQVFNTGPGGSEQRNYKLSIEDIGQLQDDYGSTTSDAGNISVGTSVSGEIQYVYDQDLFAVYLESGRIYNISMSSQFSEPVIDLSWAPDLFNSTTLISEGSSTNANGDAFVFRNYLIGTSGTYFIEVENDPRFQGVWQEVSDIGSYTLSLSSNGFTDDSDDFPSDTRKFPSSDPLWDPTSSNDFEALGGDDIVYAGGMDDVVHGGDGNDTLNGGAGYDLLEGGPGDDLLYYAGEADWLWGGAGDDRFLPDYANQMDQTYTLLGEEGLDELMLNGGNYDYKIKVELGPTWETSIVTILETTQGVTTTAQTQGIEKLHFDLPLANTISLENANQLSDIAAQMVEVYDARPLDNAYDSAASIPRNWHPLSALELGMMPSDYGQGTGTYEFLNGVYHQTQKKLFIFDNDTTVTVLTGIVDGKNTLSISFAGSGDPYDWITDFSKPLPDVLSLLSQYYEKHRPLIDALKSYLREEGPYLDQVLVSGHSLGGAMVQHLISELSDPTKSPGIDTTKLHGYTFGSIGGDAGTISAATDKIINFIHCDDIANKLNSATDTRGGTQVIIHTQLASTPDTQHYKEWYQLDVDFLVTMAEDLTTSFSKTDLASALTNGNVDLINNAYGEKVQLSLGTSSGDCILSFDDDRFVLGGNGDDRVVFDALDYVANYIKFIDGGAGKDAFVFLKPQASTSTVVQNDGGIGFSYLGTKVALLYSVENIIYLDGLKSLSGTTQTAQVASPGTTQLFVDGAHDYVEAGDGAMTVTGSAGADIVYAGRGNKTINGNGGNDILIIRPPDSGVLPTLETITLNGGAGKDLMVGGPGNETFFVDNIDDIVIGSGGSDIVKSSVSYTLPAGIATLILTGTSTTCVYGNDLDNLLQGNSAANILMGGAGVDTLMGGAGDDLYIVDDEDLIYETASIASTTDAGGVDEVKSSITRTLGAFLENLTLTGTTAINSTGNSLANTLTGNSAANTLSGLAGNDTLIGGAGRDNLTGGNGSDTLVINAVVGTSSDSGRVAVTGTTNDVGQDKINGFNLSSDTIKVVATNVSNFVHGNDTAIGTATGTANTGLQGDFTTLTGLIELTKVTNNNWNNKGDIAITFVSPSTTLTEANFEARLQYNLTGTTGNNTLKGGNLADILDGNGGNDILTGGGGHDTLTGGTGQDIFRFNSVLSATRNMDSITDFNVTDDTIQLENTGNGLFNALTGAVLVGGGTTGTLVTGAFHSGTMNVATEADDRIIYNSSTGALYYDADGSTGPATAIQFATIGTTTHPALTNADFVLI